MINKKEFELSIMGEPYKFRLLKEEDLDDRIKGLFVEFRGVCNSLDKEIIVQDMNNELGKDGNLLTMASTEEGQARCEEIIMNDTARHEIVHAFLKESGLGNEFDEASEVMVDWIALQLPKIVKACCEVHAFSDTDMQSFIDHYKIHKRKR